MKRSKQQLFLILMIAAIFFVLDNSLLFGSNVQALRQSRTLTSVCNGDDHPCYTTFCSDGQPCQTFSSDQSAIAQPAEDDTIIQPVEPSSDPLSIEGAPVVQPQEDETIIMEPVNVQPQEEENTIGQPSEDTQDIKEQDNTFRVDDQLNYLNLNPQDDKSTQEEVVQVEKDQDRDEEAATDQKDVMEEEKYSGDKGVYSSEDEHERFEQVLYGTPEGLEVETENRGIEIFVDFIEFFDDQQNLVTENPERHYNGGPLELQRGGTITLNFADCHTECDQPDAVRSVYLVNGNVDDDDILNGKVKDDQKAIFEPIDQGSFQFRVPNGVTGSHTFNKLVIETDQTDEIDAFYIGEGIEIV